MTVTLHAGTARLGLACWLAVAGWLATGCSHHSETSAGPGGEGAPQQATTAPAQQSGTATALPPGAAPSGTSGGGAGQPPGGGSNPAGGSGRAGSSGTAAVPGAPAGGTRPPRMPNLVGRNLQDAQDALQAAGVVFYSTAHDATGRNRPQLLDLTWKVCSQTPAAGQLVPKGVVPDFGVVQLDESCP